MHRFNPLVGATAMLALMSPAASAEPLKVVASFSIIADFAKEVGGDRIALTTLVGPGGDAHVYEPRPKDVAAMSDASVVLVNGLHFEGFLKRLAEASGTKAPVVELTEGVETIPAGEEGHGHESHEGGEHDNAGHDHGHDHGPIDPHAFQSVTNAKIYVANTAKAFCTADAEGCPIYEANAAAYGQKLDALDAEIKQEIASIPEGRRTIITSHDAFGYFEHTYGLRFLAPEGVSTDSEASAADVAALIRQVREDKAAAIFVENVTNPRLVEQIASETGVKLGGTLYSDALSEGPPAATYIELMRSNIATIKGAVTGS